MNYDFFPTFYLTNFKHETRVLVTCAYTFSANTMRLFSSVVLPEEVLPTIQVTIFSHRPTDKSTDNLVQRLREGLDQGKYSIANLFRSFETVGRNELWFDRACMVHADSLIPPKELTHYRLSAVEKVYLPHPNSLLESNFYGLARTSPVSAVQLTFVGKPAHVYEAPNVEGFML